MLHKYTETPLNGNEGQLQSTSLNMRDYPSTKSLSAGAMPKELGSSGKDKQGQWL